MIQFQQHCNRSMETSAPEASMESSTEETVVEGPSERPVYEKTVREETVNKKWEVD